MTKKKIELVPDISQVLNTQADAREKRADTQRLRDANGQVDLPALNETPVPSKNSSLRANFLFPQPRC